jgi:hypothetical protein
MQGGPASAFGTCAASGTTAQNPYRWTMRTSPKPRAYSKSEWCERNLIKNKRCAFNGAVLEETAVLQIRVVRTKRHKNESGTFNGKVVEKLKRP